MKNNIKLSICIGLAIGTVSVATGCTQTGSAASGAVLASATSKFDPAKTLCQPMTGQNGDQSIFANDTSGLQGRLYVVPTQDQWKYNQVRQYIANATDTGNDVFFNEVNIPTRLFSEGLPTATGALVMFNEQVLIEWFALHLESYIQLGHDNAPGQYQLALLADDGAILSVMDRNTGSFVDLVNDDGIHPTQMACSTAPLTIDSYDRVPIKLDYIQGPRYEIALQLLWRPVPKDPAQLNDPLCGTSGNYQFFNPNDSTPEQNYLDLQSRGWRPLNAANYVIPGGVSNPCAQTGFQQPQ